MKTYLHGAGRCGALIALTGLLLGGECFAQGYTDIYFTSNTTITTSTSYVGSQTNSYHVSPGVSAIWQTGAHPDNSDVVASGWVLINAGENNSGTMYFRDNHKPGGHGIAIHMGGLLNTNNTAFQNNSSGDNGGAVDIYSGTIIMNRTSFTENSTRNGPAGGLNIHGVVSATLTNMLFTSNTAGTSGTKGGGGAIGINMDYGTNSLGSLYIASSTFIGNASSGTDTRFFGGGAIAARSVVSGTITNSVFTSNTSGRAGGALDLFWTTGSTSTYGIAEANATAGNITINNSSFTNNKAGGSSGAINIGWGGVTINSSTFANNQAEIYGGAIYSSCGTLTIQNSLFQYNNAGRNGGALDIGNSGAATNTATIAGGETTIRSSTIVYNTAGVEAGGIQNSYNSRLHIYDTVISYNRAGTDGGGIHSLWGIATFDMHGGELVGNIADGNGGAVSIVTGYALLEDTNVVGNSAAGKGGAFHLGFREASSSTLAYRVSGGNTGRISGNTASQGGLAYLEANTRLIFDIDGQLSINEPGAANGLASADSNVVVQKTGTGTLTLLNDNTLYLGAVQVDAGVLSVNSNAALGSSYGVVTVNSAGTLAIRNNTSNAATLVRTLNGTGVVDVSLNQSTDTFALTPTTPGNFQGTLRMGRGTYTLDQTQSLLLKNAELEIARNSLVVLANDSQTQNVGRLAFTGGTTKFDLTIPADMTAASRITTGQVNVEGGGDILIKKTGSFVAEPPTPAGSASLVRQSGTVFVALVESTTPTVGSIGNLSLKTWDGQTVAPTQTIDIIQEEKKVADGEYGMVLTSQAPAKNGSPAKNGVFVAYGLQTLRISTGATLRVDGEEGDSNFSSRISGTGNLVLTGTLSVGNKESDFTGTTTIESGSIKLGTNNAFGDSTGVEVKDGSVLDLGGRELVTDHINTGTCSLINLNDGDLNLTNGGSIGGQITGTGAIVQNGGLLVVSSSKNDFGGDVWIFDGNVKATATGALGSDANYHVMPSGTLSPNGLDQTVGDLDNRGLIVLSDKNSPSSGNLTVNGNLRGSGSLVFRVNIASQTGTYGNNGLSDHITVNGAVTGTHRLKIVDVGVRPDGKEQPLELISSGNAKGSVIGRVDKGLSKYVVVAGGTLAKLGIIEQDDANNYYLTNAKLLGDNSLSDLGSVVAGIAGGRQLAWLGAGNQSLGGRFTDFRYNKFAANGSQTGYGNIEQETGRLWSFWAQGYGAQFNVDKKVAGVDFDLFNWGMDVGLDHLWQLDRYNVLLTGFFAGYSRSDYSYSTIDAEANDDTYRVGGYLSWSNYDGWYIDATLKGGKVDSKIKLRDEDGVSTSAKPGTYAVGPTVQVGKKFGFASGFFVEPQASVSAAYIAADKFTTSGGNVAPVKINDTIAARIALGLRTGVLLRVGQSSFVEPYVRAAIAEQITSGGKISSYGVSYTPNMDGYSLEGGLGLTWQIAESDFLNFEYTAIFGEYFTSPWGLNLGYRHRF